MYLPAAYDNSVIMDSDSYISGLGVDKNRVTATKKGHIILHNLQGLCGSNARCCTFIRISRRYPVQSRSMSLQSRASNRFPRTGVSACFLPNNGGASGF